VPADFAGQDEPGGEIDLDDFVPERVRVFGGRRTPDGAGVVDEDVDERMGLLDDVR